MQAHVIAASLFGPRLAARLLKSTAKVVVSFEIESWQSLLCSEKLFVLLNFSCPWSACVSFYSIVLTSTVNSEVKNDSELEISVSEWPRSAPRPVQARWMCANR